MISILSFHIILNKCNTKNKHLTYSFLSVWQKKRCTADGRTGSTEQGGTGEERARGECTRVEYVVVDPKRTKALKNTREAWHDGRMSTEKEKS